MHYCSAALITEYVLLLLLHTWLSVCMLRTWSKKWLASFYFKLVAGRLLCTVFMCIYHSFFDHNEGIKDQQPVCLSSPNELWYHVADVKYIIDTNRALELIEHLPHKQHWKAWWQWLRSHGTAFSHQASKVSSNGSCSLRQVEVTWTALRFCCANGILDISIRLQSRSVAHSHLVAAE